MMIDEEKLIDSIMTAIKNRSASTFQIEATKNVPDEQVFLENKQIVVSGLDLSFIKKLNSFDVKDPWVNWIQKGLSFNSEFDLKLGFNNVDLLPYQLVVKTPFTFFSKDERLINVVSRSAITRNDVMFLKEGSILLKNSHQLITDFAKEELVTRKITTVERIEEDVHGSCSW